MEDPNGAPGAESPSPADYSVLVAPVAVPEGSPEALAFAVAGDDAAATEATAGEQAAAAVSTDDSQTLSDDTSASDDATGEQAAPEDDEAADAADLAQYPERLRERFKTLSRAERREVMEYAEGRVESRVNANLEAEREAARNLKEQQDKDEAERQTVRQKYAKFTGLEDAPILDEDGTVIGKLPSYDRLNQLLGSKRGDDILEDEYGLSRDQALDLKGDLEERRTVMNGVSKHFEDRAWDQLGVQLETSLKQIEGINPVELVTGAQGIGDVVSRLHTRLKSDYEAREATLKRGYEDRIKALGVNGEALKGQAAAGSHRRLETDGRTGGSGDGEMSLAEYQRLTPEQASKLSPAVIDRMTQKLTARRAA